MLVDVLEPLLAFLAARPFAEVSRLAVVSKTLRRFSLNALKTAHQLNMSGFAESVTDGVVRLALVRVTSENLTLVNLSGCHNISAGGMEDILQYVAGHCSGVKEVDVTACSNEAVLRAVATRAAAAFGTPLAMDLFALLRSMGEDGKRCSFSNLCSLLLSDTSSTPLLLFDRGLVPRENALLQAAAHGTAPEVAMLLSLSFAVGDDEESNEDNIRTYVNEGDSEGNSPLLLACRSGKLDMAEILVFAGARVSAANKRGDTPLLAAVGAGKLELAGMLVSKRADVNAKDYSQAESPLLLACRSGNFEMAKILGCAGARVSAANKRGDTPLLAAVGAGKLELAQMLVSKGANVEAVRKDGAGLLSLAIVSQQPEMLKFALICSPKTLEHHDAMSASELAGAFTNPARIDAWLRHGASPLGLAGQVGALIASCALESSTKNRLEDVRAFLVHNLDMLEQYADRDKAAGDSRFIALLNTPEKHLCRSIHQAQSDVRAVCYSPDGSKLVRAEGSEVVVCGACTGFVEKTVTVDSGSCGVLSISYAPADSYDVTSVSYSPAGDMIAAGCSNGKIHLLDTATFAVKQSFRGHPDW
jgi:hypothetical protein